MSKSTLNTLQRMNVGLHKKWCSKHIVITFQLLFLSKTECLVSPLLGKCKTLSPTSTPRQRSYFTKTCMRHDFPYVLNYWHSSQSSDDIGKHNNIIMSLESEENQSSQEKTSLPKMLSVHTANITEVHNVPMSVLIRPFPSHLDEDKVISLMKTIENPETEENVPPIDILWVKGREGGSYYYSFGGCHRYEAYKRLKRETIPCKLVKSSIENLKPYLGGSTPDLL